MVERNIDVVFCIDGTGSMNPIIDTIKEKAFRIDNALREKALSLGVSALSVRVKTIVFRDYQVDPEPMDISSWYELPFDSERFSKKVDSIRAIGGGDITENGFEALYYAMKSDFVAGSRDRQVIVLVTDADALDLGERAGCPNYPSDMVDFIGLAEIWSGKSNDPAIHLSAHGKRLIMFAPEGSKYERFADEAERFIYFHPIAPGEGLNELDFDSFLNAICETF